MTQLPQSFYVEKVRKEKGTRLHIWLAALLALASGWLLFDLPGAPLHLLTIPDDMPNFGFGLEDNFITEDGTWIIKRKYYADRMSRYEIDAQGNLSKYRGALRDVNPEMEGGSAAPESLTMENGTLPKIKPSRRYYQQQSDIRKSHAAVPKQGQAAQTPEQRAIEAALKKHKLEEPYVLIMNYRPNHIEAVPVLEGQMHYEVLDSWMFHRPYIWVTTDRLKQLHKIRVSDATGSVVAKVEQSVPIDLDYVPKFDSKLGYDPHSEQLYLITYRGERLWFNPETLEAKGKEQLPGVWEREYGAFGFMAERPGYPQYAIGFGRVGGLPLTETGYQRLMRLLAVTFIASLIWLGLELIKAWKSTSGQTTAATS